MPLLNFNPKVIAHRGASAYAPENTLAAFAKAIDIGVKWIEFDVMLAACGTPVIFHDELLDRTTNGKGSLHNKTLTELKTLDAGAWFHSNFTGETIPSLLEVLAYLSANSVSANIELKPQEGEEERLAEAVIETLRSVKMQDHQIILFSSFSINALYALRKLSPDAFIGVLFDEWRDDWLKIVQDLNAVSVHVNDEILTPEYVLDIKRTQKKLLCYTVNDPAVALRLFEWGVDAVFTDVPDRIIGALSLE